MRDRFQVSERVSIQKEKAMNKTVSARLTNIFRVLKYRDGESEPYEIVETHNALTSAGKDLFLQIGIGASSDHLTNATDLRVYNSGGSLQTTLTSCDSGFPKTSDDAAVSIKNLVFQWTDSSTNTYSAYRLDVVTPAGTTFSQGNLGFGTKATNEQWTYEYTVTISSADSDFVDEGLDSWLRMLVNFNSNHWSSGGTYCRIYNGLSIVQTKTPSAGPSVDTVNDRVTWVFTFSDGQANGDWGAYTMKIESNTFIDADVDLRDGSTGTTGVKGSGDTWTLTYQFSIT